jgi:hypothetical protein
VGPRRDRVGANRPAADGPDELLDDPNNRVWITLLNAADRLDAVLMEFGFTPERDRAPDPGGGRFGLQPRTENDLDSAGSLRSIWREYIRAFPRYRDAVTRSTAERRAARRAGALARWRRRR